VPVFLYIATEGRKLTPVYFLSTPLFLIFIPHL